ncbi:MAG: YihA family ribosome biogenesis GTP-binding protein [Lachnospiraceae bacterium]|nr:YihA family ribosome biogenesis GTP-binding protein [Lachnospiraceae bacterium]
MVIRSIDLEIVVGPASRIPATQLPEFAFAGKSNVGKSSLINALMNRKSYARTSAKPGKTQTINFYNINEAFYLVDLPGYGFAKVSRSEQERWGKMIEKYLEKSRQLRQVFLLIDIRHQPGANDVQMYQWIVSRGFSPVIIATKADKVSRGQYEKQKKLIRETLGAGADTLIIPFSAETKLGRDEIYELLTLEEAAQPV